MVSLPPLSGYSIWLLPEQKDFEFIREIIRELADFSGSVLFSPHCTLHSFPAETGHEKMNNVVDNLLRQTGKLTIPVKDIRSDNQNYQSLYVQLKYTQELKQIKKECTNNQDPKAVENYQPHISLYYGNMELSEKKKFRTKFKNILPDAVTFDRLAIIKLEENVENWETLRETELIQF